MQANHHRRLLDSVGQQQMARHPVAFFTGEREADLGSVFDLLLILNFQQRVCLLKPVKADQLDQLLAGFFLPLQEVFALVGHGGFYLFHPFNVILVCRFHSNDSFHFLPNCSLQDLVLGFFTKRYIQRTVAAHPNHQIFMLLRIFPRRQQHIPVQQVKLQ